MVIIALAVFTLYYRKIIDKISSVWTNLVYKRINEFAFESTCVKYDKQDQQGKAAFNERNPQTT
jgi:hypothetical protein